MNIVANQRSAFLARATDDARRLAHSLLDLSEPQRAAILAIVASKSATPLDSVMLTGSHQDALEASAILDGVLTRDMSERWAWNVNSGCRFYIELLPKESIHA